MSAESRKAAQKIWYLEVVKPRRQMWLEENGPCARCGANENLEVDHIDPLTKVSHNVWTWAEEKRLKEAILRKICTVGMQQILRK